MTTTFNIPSSKPALLDKATRIAHEFAASFAGDDVVGIVFLGAVARGYFDRSADIDIAIFKKPASTIAPDKFRKIDGLEVQVWLSDFESELAAAWDMPRRWTYSQSRIFYDPAGKVAALLKEKVPLKPDERKWLVMSGLTLSEWYINGLTQVWVERGNLVSAHHMFSQGLNYFFDLLFGLNGQLVPDMKWRYYGAEQLERLPRHFQAQFQDAMRLHAFSLEELNRRRSAFMEMWLEMKPLAEAEVQMTFDEMVAVV